MEALNLWLAHWEPLWLFLILAYEGAVGTATLGILVVEYWYDKEFNETIKDARKAKRRKKYEQHVATIQPIIPDTTEVKP